MSKLILDVIEGAKEQFAQYGEFVVDLATDNDVLRDIPVVEHAARLLAVRDVYHLNIFKRNYLKFIKAVSELKENEIQSLYEKLNIDTQLSNESKEVILNVIIESRGPIKAELLARLLMSVARNELTLEEYYILALIIEAGSVAALESLKSFVINQDGKMYLDARKVQQEGLLFSLGVATRYGNMFRLDENAIKIAKFGFCLQVIE